MKMGDLRIPQTPEMGSPEMAARLFYLIISRFLYLEESHSIVRKIIYLRIILDKSIKIG